jgi:hypothetical protein
LTFDEGSDRDGKIYRICSNMISQQVRPQPEYYHMLRDNKEVNLQKLAEDQELLVALAT